MNTTIKCDICLKRGELAVTIEHAGALRVVCTHCAAWAVHEAFAEDLAYMAEEDEEGAA